MTKSSDATPSAEDAVKPHDAAVQRALVEAQEEILVFLRQRLRNQDEAEEVLQRFSLRVLERSGQLRDVQTVRGRSEEHTSELQSLMRISYAVFCLKKKTKKR